MKDAGHRQTIEAALNMEKTDRTPVNNFALVTAARSAGLMVKDARYEPKVSAKVSVDYALKTKSDFVKPVVDSQIVFLDMGMDVQMPDDDYGRVRSKYINDVSEIDDLAFFDPSKASECPHFDLCILQALKETEKYLPEDLHVCGLSWGPISTAGYLMGTEDLLMATMMGEEEAVGKLIQKCAGMEQVQNASGLYDEGSRFCGEITGSDKCKILKSDFMCCMALIGKNPGNAQQLPDCFLALSNQMQSVITGKMRGSNFGSGT